MTYNVWCAPFFLVIIPTLLTFFNLFFWTFMRSNHACLNVRTTYEGSSNNLWTTYWRPQTDDDRTKYNYFLFVWYCFQLDVESVPLRIQSIVCNTIHFAINDYKTIIEFVNNLKLFVCLCFFYMIWTNSIFVFMLWLSSW